MMTTAGNVAMRYMGAHKAASLNIGSCSVRVRHSRVSTCSMSLVATSLRAARAYSAPASRGQIAAPPFLT